MTADNTRAVSSDSELLRQSDGSYLTPDRTYRVNDEDIANAVAADQWNCAIVCAIQRQVPDAMRVTANKKHIAYSVGETRFIFPTPPDAVEKIIKPLDTGQEVKPMTIRLQNGRARPVVHYGVEHVVYNRKWHREHVKNDDHPSAARFERFRRSGEPTE